MRQNQKGFSMAILALIIVVGAVAAVGVYTAKKNGVSLAQQSGATIEVITGAGGMPPDVSRGKLLTDEEFTVVFTEPFQSLQNWQSANIIEQVSTTTGKASIDLPKGKYGVYYVYEGQKRLYDDLTLENPRNDIQRDKQGPWYIEIKGLQRPKLIFHVNSQPS
jgi:hypothetical protein